MTKPTLKTRRSWPSPSHNHSTSTSQSIDNDPFAYFVSPPLATSNHDAPTLDDEVAGTSTPRPTMRRRAHSLSPDLQKARRFLAHHSPTASPTFKLRRWIERMEQRSCSHASSVEALSPEIIEIRPRGASANDSPADTPELTSDSDTDGEQEGIINRPPQRSPPSFRGRRYVRVGSGTRVLRRRPRSWRPPSDDLGTILEEGDREEDGYGLGILGFDRDPEGRE